jgi:hypothetical protein
MLKTISRIFVIMLVTTIVAGSLYVLVQNNSPSSAFSGREAGGRTFIGQGTTITANGQNLQIASQSRFRGDRGFDGWFSFSLNRGLFGAIGNVIEIAMITAIIVLMRKAMSSQTLRKQPVEIN